MPLRSMFMIDWSDGRPKCTGAERFFRGHEIPMGPGRAADRFMGEWTWDGERLTARTDRFGMHPIYYYHDGSRFAISTNPLHILDAGFPSPIDYEAIGLFLRMCNFFNGDTPWTKIKALPPSGTLVADREGVRVAGGPARGPKPLLISRDQAMDGFTDLVRQAVARRVPPTDRLAHPLSGGRDSRHILLELDRLKVRPKEVVTWAPFINGGGREADIAKNVATMLGLPHTLVPGVRTFTAHEFDKNLDTGFCAPDHHLFIPLREYMRGKFDCIYDGIAGDVLSQDSFITPERIQMFRDGRYEELGLDHFKSLGMSEEAIRWLVGEDVYRRMPIESSFEKFAESCRPFANEFRGYTLWTFYTRTTRMIGLAPFHMFREIPTVFAPYLDLDVFEFMTAIPSELVRDCLFHDLAIERAFPQTKMVGFSPAPSRTVKYSVSPAKQAAALRDLFAFAAMHNVTRVPSIARWAMAPKIGGPAAGVPRKWITYWPQFEACEHPTKLRAFLEQVDRPHTPQSVVRAA